MVLSLSHYLRELYRPRSSREASQHHLQASLTVHGAQRRSEQFGLPNYQDVFGLSPAFGGVEAYD